MSENMESQNTNHEHSHDHDHEHEKESGSVRPKTERDPNYWLSLEQLANNEEYQEMLSKEFQSSPMAEGSEDGFARRDFLKLMGASIAMASAAGCRRPVQKIVPYTVQPEEVTFAVANYYSSTFFDGSEALGLLVKTREGRPLKIEGNPKHPMNKGATSVRAQAHILSLYDPERLQGPIKNLLNKERTNRDTISTKWEEADDAIVKQLKEGGVAVLTGAVNSPSLRSLVSEFAQGFNAQVYSYEPLAHEEIREGRKASFGEESVPFYRFDKAQVIVSIDADFLGTWLMPTTYTKQFSAGRKDIKNMSKLVAFDSHYSLTGANADVRVRIKPSQQILVALGLAHAVAAKLGINKAELSAYANVAQEIGMDPALFAKVAEDLAAQKGKSLVVAGGLQTLTRSAVDLQIVVNFINSILGNEGSTIESTVPGLNAGYSDIQKLVEQLEKGAVKTLIIHGTNPGYSLPKSSGFQEAIKKAGMVIYTGDRNDETGKMAHYVLPDHHALEAWGDQEIGKGLFSIHQPTIRPLYDTRSVQLSLMTWAFMAERGPKRIREYETYYDYLRAFWKEEIFPKAGKGAGFEDFWDLALQDGFVGAVVSAGSKNFNSAALANVKVTKATGMELVLYPTVALGDGSLANVAWLQELPDPITKICWDNYVQLSIATAAKLGVKQGEMLKFKVNSQTYQLPVHIQPGLHDEVMAVPVGYGRTDAGKVGNGIGLNSYELVEFNKGNPVFAGQFVTEISGTKKIYPLANTQAHHAMEGRQIVVEATLAQYLKDPSAGRHKHNIFSMWSGHQYNGHKWGMAIDLNSCTGCNACVVACQSENNIPVVGKKYVLQGREMHWIRVDRYYVGKPEEAEAVFQPLTCQHCDNAPCESVCPVAATVHSSEGTNDMVYNRCVGTRYCSNNCPYKVRRFNWFNYTKNIEKPMHLALNPEVTVRIRGVMEKCTFCTQRIKEGKMKAKIESRLVKDGDIKTACQTVCPADAIVFGDVNDPTSQVSKMFKDERSYGLLEEFNAAPMVRYQAKIRNNGQESRGGHGGAHASQSEGGH